MLSSKWWRECSVEHQSAGRQVCGYRKRYQQGPVFSTTLYGFALHSHHQLWPTRPNRYPNVKQENIGSGALPQCCSRKFLDELAGLLNKLMSMIKSKYGLLTQMCANLLTFSANGFACSASMDILCCSHTACMMKICSLHLTVSLSYLIVTKEMQTWALTKAEEASRPSNWMKVQPSVITLYVTHAIDCRKCWVMMGA